MAEGRDERSLGDLLAQLMGQMSTLVRQELTLAGTEVTQRASRVGKDVGLLLAGGALLYAAVLALLAAIILALGALGLPWWLAALIVAVVVAAIGATLVMRARRALRHADLVPHTTMETLTEDRVWAHEQID